MKVRHRIHVVERSVRIAQDDEDACTCGHSETHPCKACRDDREWVIRKMRARREAERPKVDEPELPVPF